MNGIRAPLSFRSQTTNCWAMDLGSFSRKLLTAQKTLTQRRFVLLTLSAAVISNCIFQIINPLTGKKMYVPTS